MDQGLQIIVSADVQTAIKSLSNLTDATAELATEGVGNITSVEVALKELRAAQQEAGDTAQIQVLNRAIKDLSAEASRLRNIGVDGFDDMGRSLNSIQGPAQNAQRGLSGLNLTTTQSRIAFVDLGRVVTGQGFSLRALAANFTLLGPAVTIVAAAVYGLVELFTQQSDAQKKAASDAKKLAEELLNLKTAQDVTLSATGSEQGNILRVQALAAAIQDTNKTYKERQNALNELRETNKAYFGDLTLEASSLKTLGDRVKDYSAALITEAVVKGQVEEIAKISSELNKQKERLVELKDARDRANASFEEAKKIPTTSGGTGGVGDLSQALEARTAQAANDAFSKQQVVVDKLSTSIAGYTGELQKNIELQIQQKPLQIPPKTTDDLKDIVSILKEIKSIYDELAKPNKEPLFKQLSDSTNANDIKLIETQIHEAIANGVSKGATDPKVKAAYDSLAVALEAKLNRLQNPNLRSVIDVGLQDVTPDVSDKIESKIEKAIGSKGLELKVPVHLRELLENDSSFDAEDRRKIQEGLQKDPGLANFYLIATPRVRLAIQKGIIQEQDLRALKEVIQKTVGGVVEQGFVSIGEGLGDILSGSANPLKKAIQGFTQILGDGLITIGKQMILASTLMQSLKAALSTLFANPVAGIALGIASVALGEVVKNVGAHAFATGGIVTGPTLGLIGEAGPEVVFPLSQLHNFLSNNTSGGGPHNINVTGQISGRNLALVMNRDSKNQGLV